MNIKNCFENKTLRFLVFVGFLIMCFVFGKIFQFDMEKMRGFFSSFPLWISGVLFVLLYVVLTNLIWFGPKDVLRISSAVLFGAGISTILVWISEMLSAMFLFCLSRKLGQDYVEQKFRLKKVKVEGMKNSSGVFGSLVLRINPLIPFRLQDLAAGLSRISLKKYLMAIAIPSCLRIYWLQFLLSALGVSIFKNPDLVNKYLMDNPKALMFSSLYFILVIALSLLAGVLKLVRVFQQRRLCKNS